MSTAIELYKLYPCHLARGKAIPVIEKALRRLRLELKLEGIDVENEIEWMKERVALFAESDAGKKDGLFAGYRPPYPATWFHQSRYLDDPAEWQAHKPRDVYEEFLTRGAGQ